MPIVASDLVAYAAANMPEDESSTVGGAIDTDNRVVFTDIAATDEPDDLRRVLEQALGAAGRVRKERTLYLIGRTRVHLDRVEGLGDFVELEVVLAEGEAEASGLAEARRLMAALGIDETALIAGAYVDLLAATPPNT